MKTILAPIDFSGATSPMLEVANGLAHSLRAKIVLLNVLRPAVIADEYSPLVQRLAIAAGKSTREKLAQWQVELQNDGCTVETKQLYGLPAACIREEAERIEADYIVIGSHGHGAQYSMAIGGTASGLLKKAPCPVLIVPITGLKPALIDFGTGVEGQSVEALSCRSIHSVSNLPLDRR